jgi:hypothetical protein
MFVRKQRGNQEMAIYHMSVQVISRSAGRSAIAAAAYRAGEQINDARTGAVHDYTRKKDVDYQEILIPEGVGDWANDRDELWNKVELAEKRKDAQLAREINIAIPHELSAEQGRELVRDYAQRNFVDQGMIADICIHDEKGNNPHAHIMLSMREAQTDGFGQKVRDWNDKQQLESWREDWAHSCNKSLEKAGYDVTIDHRTLEAQGIDREPTKHLGPVATAMERRGFDSDRGDINRDIIGLNALTKSLQEISKEIVVLQQEVELPKSDDAPPDEPSPKPEPQVQAVESAPDDAPPDDDALANIKDAIRDASKDEITAYMADLHEASYRRCAELEAKNTPEYMEKVAKIEKLELEVKMRAESAANYDKIKEERGRLQFWQKAEDAKNAEAERTLARNASKAVADEKSKLAALQHNLTRDGSALANDVKQHNERAVIAENVRKSIKLTVEQRLDEIKKQEHDQKQQEQDRIKSEKVDALKTLPTEDVLKKHPDLARECAYIDHMTSQIREQVKDPKEIKELVQLVKDKVATNYDAGLKAPDVSESREQEQSRTQEEARNQGQQDKAPPSQAARANSPVKKSVFRQDSDKQPSNICLNSGFLIET